MTAAELQQAIAILGQHDRVIDALPAIEHALQRRVSERWLREAMAKGGHGSPREHLRRVVIPAPETRGRVAAATDAAGGYSCTRPAPSMTPERPFIERHVPVSEGLPITTAGRTTFVISDMHVPFHDPQVWAAKLAIIRFLRPEAVVIIGDWFDFYAVSFFPKDPRRKSLVFDEIQEGIPLLDELEACRVPNVFFLQGNHEERLDRYVTANAPALHGMVKTLPEVARIAERGWHWVPYKRSIAIGKMRYSHDFTRCGVNAGRQALLDVGKSVTFGHTHRLGVAYQGTIEDDAHVSLNVGWGGDFNKVDYAHRDRARRDWLHGCGIVDEDERGFVWPQSVAIIDGTAMVRGQKVAA